MLFKGTSVEARCKFSDDFVEVFEQGMSDGRVFHRLTVINSKIYDTWLVCCGVFAQGGKANLDL